MTPISHAQMETFVAETITTLRSVSDAQVTLGAAAFKCARAWSFGDEHRIKEAGRSTPSCVGRSARISESMRAEVARSGVESA